VGHGLKLSWRHELIKSFQAVSRVNKLKLADISGMVSVPIALMMGTETIPETSVSFSLLTRLLN
jgi:hypothetical protein